MLKLVGAYGSPYSRKMRAVLRYRRIPFRWIVRGSRHEAGIPLIENNPPLIFHPSEEPAPGLKTDFTNYLRRACVFARAVRLLFDRFHFFDFAIK